ncbi:cell wall-binding repeat-containing protein [Herbiconiux sp. YIM B11900]|uniref:cell wall-binding repeat-containing protein n=1 Tax=Herbiconiux sp. YIM B11900 TaxID=3404131 RepID=UPI003F83D130
MHHRSIAGSPVESRQTESRQTASDQTGSRQTASGQTGTAGRAPRRRAAALAITAAIAVSLIGAPLAAHAETAPAPTPSGVSRTDSPVTGGAPASGDPSLQKAGDKTYKVYQYGGADRYEVAVNVTLDSVGDVVPVLYIASGQNYPDALSAGPAAAHQGGALLLVTRDSIPEVTRQAILQLQPQKIVVVGGVNTISAGVYDQLAALQPSIVRLAGADRYEVSRAVVDYAFCGTLPGSEATECAGDSDDIFLATGSNYPDALAAGPAAAHLDAAVLLVHGTSSSLDDPTKSLLHRVRASSGHIAGGPNSVSDGIENDLRSTIGFAVRYAGADRFDVAVNMNYDVFRGKVTDVFVASGYVFPDALSAGPAAAVYGAPLYLVRPYCYPGPVADAIFQSYLDPDNLDLMGGPNTIGDGVFPNPRYCD